MWTIGYGNTSFLKRINYDLNPDPNLQITQQKASELLESDLSSYLQSVIQCTLKLNLTQGQIASLTSLCFNIGVSAFEKSTLIKVIKNNPNDLESIEREFLKWSFVNNKESVGLKKRRKMEYKIYSENATF